MDDADDGLLNIHLSDSEEEQNHTSRNSQSEAAFQAIKASYCPKLQNGDLHKSISLPVGPGANKQYYQDIVHAVEELYFLRRYAEAVAFVAKVLRKGGDRGDEDGLDEDTRALLHIYDDRCKDRLGTQS